MRPYQKGERPGVPGEVGEKVRDGETKEGKTRLEQSKFYWSTEEEKKEIYKYGYREGGGGRVRQVKW